MTQVFGPLLPMLETWNKLLHLGFQLALVQGSLAIWGVNSLTKDSYLSLPFLLSNFNFKYTYVLKDELCNGD